MLVSGLLIAARLLFGASSVSHDSSDRRPALWCPAPVKVLEPPIPSDDFVVWFPVHNRGTRRLVLTPSEEGCRCGDNPPSAIIIPPGGRENIAVTIPARSTNTPLLKTLRFQSNDPLHPRLDLTVTAL